ncbi:Spy/CpxP family protein refolding chaperone [Shewanella sp.]|nr:Spy/CpxP family protein refolding chaperone [Shewanella sp.]
MKKNTLKASLLAVVASTTLLTGNVYAGNDKVAHDGHGKGRSHQSMLARGEHNELRKMFRGLDLSDAQKQDLKALFSEHRAEMKQQRLSKADRVAQKEQVLGFITDSHFSEEAVKNALTAKLDTRQQQMVNRLKLQNQAYQLLTPEQQTQFKQRFLKRGLKRQQK